MQVERDKINITFQGILIFTKALVFFCGIGQIIELFFCVLIDKLAKMSNQMPVIPSLRKVTVSSKCLGRHWDCSRCSCGSKGMSSWQAASVTYHGVCRVKSSRGTWCWPLSQSALLTAGLGAGTLGDMMAFPRCLRDFSRVLWVKMAQNISRTTFAGGFLFKCVSSGEMQRGKAKHILLESQTKSSLVLACLVYHPNFLVSLSFPAEGTSPMSPAAALGMAGNRARHEFRASRPAVPRT